MGITMFFFNFSFRCSKTRPQFFLERVIDLFGAAFLRAEVAIFIRVYTHISGCVYGLFLFFLQLFA